MPAEKVSQIQLSVRALIKTLHCGAESAWERQANPEQAGRCRASRSIEVRVRTAVPRNTPMLDSETDRAINASSWGCSVTFMGSGNPMEVT